jgi:hypothetical protein
MRRLKAPTVERAKAPELYPDGGGLGLQVQGAGARSWMFCFKVRGIANGKARIMILGSIHDISLVGARGTAAACRRLIAEGKDPIAERKVERKRQDFEATRTKTFRQCSEAYIEAKKPSGRNKKLADQRRNTLRDHVYPIFG